MGLFGWKFESYKKDLKNRLNCLICFLLLWRGGWVVETNCLESSRPGNWTEGSNPSLSEFYTKYNCMQFKYKTRISFVSILINLVVITGFFYLMFYSYKFKAFSKPTIVKAYENNVSILKEEIPNTTLISPNGIYISNKQSWLIYYIVQPWDTLSKIALNFWVTVSHIKKINKLKNNIINPWQKLTITDQVWFIYISKWETLKQLANRYKITEKAILEANSLNSPNDWFHKWDEIFIPISEKKYKKLFPKIKNYHILEPRRFISTRNKKLNWNNIIRTYWYKPNVFNGFYRWQCTRFVAIKKFPYINRHRQKKLWNGNAKWWYYHAKIKWYKVWHTPKIWAIIVLNYWYYWHVAIVKKIDWRHRKILVEEMNYLWIYIVTYRWIPMKLSVIGYIYI